MGERGSGTILLTGGGFSLAPNPEYISLSIGKAGVRAMTLGMFESLKQKAGIDSLVKAQGAKRTQAARSP